MASSRISFLAKLAFATAAESKDPDKQVGFALADAGGMVLSLGRNGYPIGIKDQQGAHTNAEKLARSIHAEENAFMMADRNRLAGAVGFCTEHPCAPCAARIVQHSQLFGPIGLLVVKHPNGPESKWWESHRLAIKVFEEAGIPVANWHFSGLIHDFNLLVSPRSHEAAVHSWVAQHRDLAAAAKAESLLLPDF